MYARHRVHRVRVLPRVGVRHMRSRHPLSSNLQAKCWGDTSPQTTTS